MMTRPWRTLARHDCYSSCLQKNLRHCDKPTYSGVLQGSSADKFQSIQGNVTTPGGNEPLPPVLPDHIRALHDQLVVLQRQYKEALAEYQNKEGERLGTTEEFPRKIPAHLKSRHPTCRLYPAPLTKQDVKDIVTKVIQKFLTYQPGVPDIRSGRSLQETAVKAPSEGVVTEGTTAPPHKYVQ